LDTGATGVVLYGQGDEVHVFSNAGWVRRTTTDALVHVDEPAPELRTVADDVRVFAGCLTGRRNWATLTCAKTAGVRLEAALAHRELRLAHLDDDAQRPRLSMDVIHEETHAAFRGFNRAQGAVLECAILVSRLHMLPAEKIDAELRYLEIAIEKTAGPAEREAWSWLLERIEAFRLNKGIDA